MLLAYAPPTPDQSPAARLARAALAGWAPAHPTEARLLTQEFRARSAPLVSASWQSLETLFSERIAKRQGLLGAWLVEGRMWGVWASISALGPVGPALLANGGFDQW